MLLYLGKITAALGGTIAEGSHSFDSILGRIQQGTLVIGEGCLVLGISMFRDIIAVTEATAGVCQYNGVFALEVWGISGSLDLFSSASLRGSANNFTFCIYLAADSTRAASSLAINQFYTFQF